MFCINSLLVSLSKAMAEVIRSDFLTCPICMELLKDPVTIFCGHNYCMRCINDSWDQGHLNGVYSCPLCRQTVTYSEKPILNKNDEFAELVEKIKRTRIQPAPAICIAGRPPDEVLCDVCGERKLKAVKSCLECLVSYCEAHFKAHNEDNIGRTHHIIDATGQLRERICPNHKKPLEIFCRTDRNCVCFLCLVNDHKGHDTVSVSTGRTETETHLEEIQRTYQQKIQDREKMIEELAQAMKTLKSSAQVAVEDSHRMFTEMIRSIERRSSVVTKLIRAQEEAEMSRAEGLLKQLEQEIVELKRGDAELEDLAHTENHIHFLKTFQLFSDHSHFKDISSIYVDQYLSFDTVTTSVATLKKQLDDFCKQEVVKISTAVSKVQAVFPEPVTREEFLRYSCNLMLDPNTAYNKLRLSEGNRRAERVDDLQPYPDHPDRFDTLFQVLCTRGVSGRCYWEVEWAGKLVYIAVAYKSIMRKGWDAERRFGCNNQSWRLRIYGSRASFCHDNKETELPPVHSSRIGVYMDHRAGTLALYTISGTGMTLLHKAQATFTQALYPGFWLNRGSSVKLL